MHQPVCWANKNHPKVTVKLQKIYILWWWWCFQSIRNHRLKIRMVDFRCHNPRAFLMGLWPGIPRNFHYSKTASKKFHFKVCTRWWFQGFFIFNPNLGELHGIAPIRRSYVSNRLGQPPTRFNSKACNGIDATSLDATDIFLMKHSEQSNAIDEYGHQRLERIKNSWNIGST